MNWIIFILIFISLLRGPGVSMQGNAKENLRKLKEKFMIALGLSTLFGMGWAIGLLASSDLPDGVRYPAEWIFTLMTAFLGVYLFALYVIRSAEARKFWKKWLLCQHGKSRGYSFSSTLNRSRSRFRSFSSTLTSWTGTLGRESRSYPPSSHTDACGGDLSLEEKMKPEEWHCSESFSPEASISILESIREDRVENIYSGLGADPVYAELSMAEEPPEKVDPNGYAACGSLSAVNYYAIACQSPPSPSGTEEDCYTVKNQQTEEVTSL